MLEPAAERILRDLLGRDLSVWDGAARVYLPGPLQPWRHRYYLREVIE